MRVLVSGASGLVGKALCAALVSDGHEVITLGRGPGSDVRWDIDADDLDLTAIGTLDAVVHLAGESVAGARWTAARKARIRDSRVKGTRLLVDRLCRLDSRPSVFLSASGIGYYGDCEDREVDETAPRGGGFLAGVCEEWEAASQPLVDAGVRVVRCRLGMVLAPQGGALAKMLPAFRMGLGGRLGNGRQGVSWVSLRDVVAILGFAVRSEALSGPVNVVAPGPVTNQAFTRALGRACGRPTWSPAPAWLLKLVLGEMAEELLLGGAMVKPTRLQDAGFDFQDTDLDATLRRLLA